MLINGAVVGAVSAVVGVALALAAWLGFASTLEGPAGHRIERFDVPWWLVGSGVLLAVGTATAAAWWPARTTARVPITDALSARPPVPKSTRRPAAAAAVFAVVGFVCLASGVDTKRDHANVPLLLAGVVAFVLAVLLIGPLAIRALAAAGGRLPDRGAARAPRPQPLPRAVGIGARRDRCGPGHRRRDHRHRRGRRAHRRGGQSLEPAARGEKRRRRIRARANERPTTPRSAGRSIASRVHSIMRRS